MVMVNVSVLIQDFKKINDNNGINGNNSSNNGTATVTLITHIKVLTAIMVTNTTVLLEKKKNIICLDPGAKDMIVTSGSN